MTEIEDIRTRIEEQIPEHITTRLPAIFPANRTYEEILAEVRSTYQEIYGTVNQQSDQS